MQKEDVNVLAERLKTPAWLLAGAKIRLGWVIGTEITETDFKSGLESFVSAPTHSDLSVPEVVAAPVVVLTQALQTRQDTDDAEAKAKLEAEEAEADAKAKLEADKTAKGGKR